MRQSNSNRQLAKILELRAPTHAPDFERTTTISKLVSAKGEIEDVLARYAKSHVTTATLLALGDRQSLREMIRTINAIVERLEQNQSGKSHADRVV